MQGEGCHGALVAQVEDDIEVGFQTVLKPFQFGGIRQLWLSHHQVLAPRAQFQVMVVEVMDGGVGEDKGALIATIDIAEISAVGILAG